VTWFVGGVREAGVGEGPQREFEAVVDASLKEDGFEEIGRVLFPTKTDIDYTSVGKLLGLWLYQGKQLSASSHIYTGVFEYILNPEGYQKTLQDLEDIDEELYTHLKWLRDNDISDIEDSMVVTTEATKHSYIEEQVMLKTYNENFEQIRAGFFQIIHENEIAFFSGKELSVMLGGGERNSVDVAEWKRRTTYTVRPNDQLVHWFWDFVAKLSVGEQSLLLQFATGRFMLPKNFIIACSERGEDSLPQASTCINLISLPRYGSREKLEEMLLIALRHGAVGYSFA
jgi:E3 ubiquitin-protein ligase HUWE1